MDTNSTLNCNVPINSLKYILVNVLYITTEVAMQNTCSNIVFLLILCVDAVVSNTPNPDSKPLL